MNLEWLPFRELFLIYYLTPTGSSSLPFSSTLVMSDLLVPHDRTQCSCQDKWKMFWVCRCVINSTTTTSIFIGDALYFSHWKFESENTPKVSFFFVEKVLTVTQQGKCQPRRTLSGPTAFCGNTLQGWQVWNSLPGQNMACPGFWTGI